MRKAFAWLFCGCLLAACGPQATPEVIPDMSRANTRTAAARPTLTPTGPTPIPTATGTPYIRPTDDTAVDQSLPIVKIGAETITLGQFRARVRYERFKALNDMRRLIESVGIAQMRLDVPQPGPAAQQVAAVFNTLANSGAFGRQVFTIMVRESILRQEAVARNLSARSSDIDAYWMRQFVLHTDPQGAAKLKESFDVFSRVAQAYSTLTPDDLNRIAEANVLGSAVRPLIIKAYAKPPQPLTFQVRRIITTTQADADAALAALKAGQPFRDVACRYSTDPAVRGNGGNLGWVSRGQLVAGLQDAEQVFTADVGAVVGPLASPLGYHVFKINGRRQNADGDTQVDAQSILVATEILAAELKQRAAAGEAFAALACQYSLDKTGGNGGDYGTMSQDALPDEVFLALNQSKEDMGLFGPIKTATAYEVVEMLGRKLDIIKPEDIDKANEKAFEDWLAARETSTFVTTLTEDWKQAIPSDPLPKDVSPLMVEENFGLPTPVPTATTTPIPTTSGTPTG